MYTQEVHDYFGDVSREESERDGKDDDDVVTVTLGTS